MSAIDIRPCICRTSGPLADKCILLLHQDGRNGYSQLYLRKNLRSLIYSIQPYVYLIEN